jgi:valyl-tRNA synthetase
MRLGKCQRSHDIIEPIIKPQWYVKCGDIANDMIAAVKNKDLVIMPTSEEDTWFRWI